MQGEESYVNSDCLSSSPSSSPPSSSFRYWLIIFFGKIFDECLRKLMRILLHIKWISVKAPVVWVPGIFHGLFFFNVPNGLTMWELISLFYAWGNQGSESFSDCFWASNPFLFDPRALGLPSMMHVLWLEALTANWNLRSCRVQQSSPNGAEDAEPAWSHSSEQDHSQNLFKSRFCRLLLYRFKWEGSLYSWNISCINLVWCGIFS